MKLNVETANFTCSRVSEKNRGKCDFSISWLRLNNELMAYIPCADTRMPCHAMSSQPENVVKKGLVGIKSKCIGGVMSTSYYSSLKCISIDQAAFKQRICYGCTAVACKQDIPDSYLYIPKNILESKSHNKVLTNIHLPQRN
jgi:hypothetical protein